MRHVTQNQYAAFLEDRFSLTERLALLGQLRYNHMNMDWRFQGRRKRAARIPTFSAPGAWAPAMH
ncbi:TonB-dependent receptor [Serratia ureilytica]